MGVEDSKGLVNKFPVRQEGEVLGKMDCCPIQFLDGPALTREGDHGQDREVE